MPDYKAQIAVDIIRTGEGGKQAVDELKQVEGAAKNTATGFKELAAVGAAALAAIGGTRFLKDCATDALEAESANKRLGIALKNAGLTSSETKREMIELADRVRDLTGADAEEVKGIESLLVSMGARKEQVERLTIACYDLAAGMGDKGASGAAMLLGRALEGETGSLSRWGIVVSENATSTQKFSEAITQIESRFGGMSRLGSSTGSELKRLQSNVRELKEELGRALVEAIDPAVRGLTQLTRAGAGMNFAGASQLMQVGGVAVAGGAVGGGLSKISTAMEGMTLAAVLTGVKSAALAVGVGLGSLASVVSSTVESFRLFASRDREAAAMGELAAQNRALRKSLSSTVDERVANGAMTESYGASLREKLVGGGSTPDEHARLMDVARTLNPQQYVSVPSETTRESLRLTQEKAAALKDLSEMFSRLSASGLGGMESQLAEVDLAVEKLTESYNGLAAKAGLSSENRKEDLDALSAYGEQMKAVIRVTNDLQEAEREAAIAAAGGASPSAVANQRLRDSNWATNQWIGKSPLGAAQGQAFNDAAMQQYQQSMAGEGLRMSDDLADLTLNQSGSYEREWKKRRQAAEDYYAAELQNARETGRSVVEIEQQKSTHLQALDKVNTLSNKTFSDSVKNFSQSAAESFSGGLANAIVSFANGSKTASEAFTDFAIQFLTQTATMILQAIILKTVMAALGFADGGTSTTSKGAAPVKAANGIIAAADGVAGVNTVDRPTFFPNHNVLAGEAGSEMLAVLARPATADFSGIRTIVGSAGPNRLAIMPEAGARRLAAGGTSGEPGGGGGQPGGLLHIQISHSESSKAEIVSASVERATIQVARDLSRDTPISKAARRLRSS